MVADDTFQSIWQACSGNPHAEACLHHSGEGSLEIRYVAELEDGTFQVSLGLLIVVGGGDLHWGVSQGMTVAVEQTEEGWEVTRELSRVYSTLLYRPPGGG